MTKAKTKLIFLWNYVEWGGAQVYFLAIMKAARDIFDITVILPRKSMPDMMRFLDELGIRYEFLDTALKSEPATTAVQKMKRQWARVYAEIVSFRYLLRYDLRNSILHLETGPWQSWMLLTALAMRRANVFVTMHNFLPPYHKWREIVWNMRLQFVSRLPGFHIFPSNQDTKNKLRGWVSDEFIERTVVTYTAINPVEIEEAFDAELDVANERRRLGIDENKIVVLCVGQFIDRKGRWVFLDSAKKICETENNIQFAWLTPKMPSSEVMATIETYGLGDKFKLILSETVGQNRSDILEFFRIADIFTLPSYVEGLPIALLEAMALRLPSISTNVYAIPEAVKDMETGILIEAGDSDALADAILKLKNDEDLSSRLARKGHEYVMNTFDERAVANLVIERYRSALKDR